MTLLRRAKAKLNREGKYLLRDVGHRLGFYNTFYKTAQGCSMMVYHGICLHDHTRFNPIFLKLKTFEAHLKFYKKHFNVISLDDYYQEKFSNKKFNICLTFDDGFANNHKYVLPLIEQYQLPATFFVTAIRAAGYDILWNDFLGIASKYGPKQFVYKYEIYTKGQHDKYFSVSTGMSLNDKLRKGDFIEKAEIMTFLYKLVPFKTVKKDEDYWLQMTTRQLKELASSPYATIGAHGYYHNDLACINIKEAKEELVLSRQYLQNITGEPINSIAFPYGSYNPDVVNAAKEAGYTQLLATDFNSAADHRDNTMRERFTVNPFINTNNQMYATITRKYEH